MLQPAALTFEPVDSVCERGEGYLTFHRSSTSWASQFQMADFGFQITD
jgi:hypothetical protein